MKNSRSASAAIQSPQKHNVSHILTINYCLESVAAITLRFPAMFSLLHSITNEEQCVRIVSAINPVTTENMDDSRLQHLGLSAKRNGTEKRTKVSP